MSPRVCGTQRVLQFMLDRRWHTAAEIEEACQVTAHSRLAELRKHHAIEKRHNGAGATGRRMYSYRLVATKDELLGDVDEALAELRDSREEEASGAAPRAPEAETSPGPDGARVGERVVGDPQTLVADHAQLGDAGWRDLFPAETFADTLPSPELQLELGVAP